MKRLPDKPSELLKLALTDLELVESDPRYEIDMGTWHEPSDGQCLVCAAGAVMAKSLGVKKTIHINPNDFDEDTEKKLILINALRCGLGLPEQIIFSLDEGRELSLLSQNNRPLWKQHMQDLIGVLEAEGM